MHAHPNHRPLPEEIRVTEEVIDFITKRGSDFRICTSCGGPILLPVSLKPPKPTDLKVKAGRHMIFVSVHQARYLHSIHMGMLPLFLDEVED